jgi:hypothetical protein
MATDAELSPFANWIVPKNGSAPYYVDFSEFFFGRRRSDLPSKDQRLWKSDIIGMPNMAQGFQAVILSERPPEKSYASYASAWRNMHRFFQDAPDLPTVFSLLDIGPIHGPRLKQWLVDQGLSAHLYKKIKWVVDSLSLIERGELSDMPARDALQPPDPVEPDVVGLQQISLALRRHARSIISMWKNGAALAARGIDPRPASGGKNHAWEKPENQAYLIYRLTDRYLPSRQEIRKESALPLLQTTSYIKAKRNVKGPYCPLPGTKQKTAEGYVAKLRWRFPVRSDLAIFIWIVLIYTGFNLAAVLAIDITKPSTWHVKALQDPDHVLIFVDKDRAGKKVYAPSKVKAEFHAFNIIKLIAEITEPLRETLRRQLILLLDNNRTQYSHSTQREIQKIQEAIRSPWLYVSLRDGDSRGNVRALQQNESSYLNSIIREIAKDANLTDEHPYLATLSTSQARDSMINFTYRHSRRLSVAKMAAQQSDYRSLKYYLARRKIKRANFQTVNKVLSHAFDDIRRNDIFDETRIKIALKTGEITPEQERKLRDIRLRTRLGMGCLSPKNPPAEIDPYHKAGSVCRVQRCTGCVHGRVFPESVQPLAAALADIRHLRSVTPLAAWKGSSFEQEEISITETLKQFDPELVKIHFQDRWTKVKNGEAVHFDVYPHY